MKVVAYITAILVMAGCALGTDLLPNLEEDVCGYKVSWRENTSEEQRVAIRHIIRDMVWLDEAYFMMGATDEQAPYANKDEFPAHMVYLSSYSIGVHAVYSVDVKSILWEYYPFLLEKISCYDDFALFTVDSAKEFARYLSDVTGLHFDIPTEARWEFAARGGAKSHATVYVAGLHYAKLEKGELDGIANELGIYGFGADGEWCKDMYTFYEGNALLRDPCSASGKGYMCRGVNKLYDTNRGVYPVRPSVRGYSFKGNVRYRLRLTIEIDDNRYE